MPAPLDPKATKSIATAFKKPAPDEDEDKKVSFWDKLMGDTPSLDKTVTDSLKRERKRVGADK